MFADPLRLTPVDEERRREELESAATYLRDECGAVARFVVRGWWEYAPSPQYRAMGTTDAQLLSFAKQQGFVTPKGVEEGAGDAI